MTVRAIAALSAILTLFVAWTANAEPVAQTLQLSSDKQAMLAQLWPVELSIYAVRGPQNLDQRLENYSTQFMAWPPMLDRPENYEAFKANEQKNVSPGKRRISVEFVDLALSDNTAIMYTRTHLTMMPDGTPIDDYYNVVHVYVRESGSWRIMAGMARLQPPH